MSQAQAQVVAGDAGNLLAPSSAPLAQPAPTLGARTGEPTPAPSSKTSACNNQTQNQNQNQNHKTSEQQSRCYLCETPKAEYSLVRAFSEPVCRGCVNFEGPDKVELLIAAARKFKSSQQSTPTSKTAHLLNGSQDLSGREEKRPTRRGSSFRVGKCSATGAGSEQLKSGQRETLDAFLAKIPISGLAEGDAPSASNQPASVPVYQTLDAPTPVQLDPQTKPQDPALTSAKSDQRVGNYAEPQVPVSGSNYVAASDATPTSSTATKTSSESTLAHSDRQIAMTSTPVSLPAAMSAVARAYYAGRNPLLPSQFPPMAPTAAQHQQVPAYAPYPFPGPYNPYILRQIHASLHGVGAPPYPDPTVQPSGDPYLDSQRLAHFKRSLLMEPPRPVQTQQQLLPPPPFGLGQMPASGAQVGHIPYASMKLPLPAVSPNQRQPQLQSGLPHRVGPPMGQPPAHLMGGPPLSYWSQFNTMLHAQQQQQHHHHHLYHNYQQQQQQQQQLASSTGGISNGVGGPPTPEMSRAHSESPSDLHHRQRNSPRGATISAAAAAYCSLPLDPYQVQRATAYQQQQLAHQAAVAAASGQLAHDYNAPPSASHMSRLKSHLTEPSTKTNSQQHPQQQQLQQQQQQHQQQHQSSPTEMPYMSSASIRRLLTASSTNAETTPASEAYDKAHAAHLMTGSPPSIRHEFNGSLAVVADKLGGAAGERRYDTVQPPSGNQLQQQQQHQRPQTAAQKRPFRSRGSSPLVGNPQSDYANANKRPAYGEVQNQNQITHQASEESHKKDRTLKALISKRTYNKKIALLKANEQRDYEAVSTACEKSYATRQALGQLEAHDATKGLQAFSQPAPVAGARMNHAVCPVPYCSATSSSSSADKTSGSLRPLAASQPQAPQAHHPSCNGNCPPVDLEASQRQPPQASEQLQPNQQQQQPQTERLRAKSPQESTERGQRLASVDSVALESLNLKCMTCEQRLDDKHFVQCPSSTDHKFCFLCSRKSIERQRKEFERLDKESDKVFCPSGNRCDLPSESSPWTFMTNEIETIFRDTEEQAQRDDVNSSNNNNNISSSSSSGGSGNLSPNADQSSESNPTEKSDTTTDQEASSSSSSSNNRQSEKQTNFPKPATPSVESSRKSSNSSEGQSLMAAAYGESLKLAPIQFKSPPTSGKQLKTSQAAPVAAAAKETSHHLAHYRHSSGHQHHSQGQHAST